jgi:hypothetical protein
MGPNEFDDQLDSNEMLEDNADELLLDDEFDDAMDGDHDSAMSSIGWGTDEDYGAYGSDE